MGSTSPLPLQVEPGAKRTLGERKTPSTSRTIHPSAFAVGELCSGVLGAAVFVTESRYEHEVALEKKIDRNFKIESILKFWGGAISK